MTSFPKQEIVRIASVNGKLVIDKAGRAGGRGVYLCRSLDCFDAAMKKKRFGYGLKTAVQPEEVAALREEYAKEVTDAEVNL